MWTAVCSFLFQCSCPSFTYHFSLRSAIAKYIPCLGVLLCVPRRDRFSSSSFMSTRRSTLTSQSSETSCNLHRAGKTRLSSVSDSESVRKHHKARNKLYTCLWTQIIFFTFLMAYCIINIMWSTNFKYFNWISLIKWPTWNLIDQEQNIMQYIKCWVIDN